MHDQNFDWHILWQFDPRVIFLTGFFS